MVAGDHNFHPECFCCKLCNSFIGDGDSYALVERSKLYWYEMNFLEVGSLLNTFSLADNVIDVKCNLYPQI